MYNRYVPQADGSYRRNRIPDPMAPPRRNPSPPQKQKTVEAPGNPPASQQDKKTQHRPEPPETKQKPQQNQSVGSFLKQLLPKDFDTADLLIVLLLLLMAGDSDDDQNAALLTLALYFFM